MEDKHKCPVCMKYEFEGYCSLEICEVCGWQDDAVQEEEPDMKNCANAMSLNEARKAYAKGEKIF